MSNQGPEISYGITIMPPKKAAGYAVSMEEWQHIKSRLLKLDFEPFWYNEFGGSLLGIALTMLISDIASMKFEAALSMIWAFRSIYFACFIIAFAILYVTRKQSSLTRDRASDLASQMDLIEARFIRQ